MTQADWLVLALKAALISGLASLVAWVAVYHVLTRGGWRRNPIGRTLVVKSLLIAGLFIPTILSLFFHLNRFDSRIVGWSDVALIGAVAPVMAWRILVFTRLDRLGRLLGGEHDDPGGNADAP